MTKKYHKSKVACSGTHVVIEHERKITVKNLLLFLICYMTVGCEQIKATDQNTATPEDVKLQELKLDQWVDALKRVKAPFRLFKIIGSGCFVATWGYNGYGGPGLAMSPNQAACDNPANAGITKVFQLTDSSTLPAKTPTSGAR